MRRRGLAGLFLVACAAAGVLSAVALSAPNATRQETTTTGSTTAATTETTTTSTTVARPPAIAAGVTVGGVLVGGLSPADARARLRQAFARPLTVVVGSRRIRVTPKELGAAAYVGDAVAKARFARPGTNVPLAVRTTPARIDRWVRRLAADVDRAPKDARLLLRKLKPFWTKEVPGRRLNRVLAARAVTRALRRHERGPVALRLRPIQPEVTRRNAGDVIVIRRGRNRLYYYAGTKLKRVFNVATGQQQYPTPLGRFRVIVKWRNPWWYPPASDWAKDEKPIPPGPGNPLGTRWMGISSPAVGIHGTPDPASIGYSVSHGCIRMHIPEVEWLFERVEIGTPVFIVAR